jgi:hypothetical protein
MKRLLSGHTYVYESISFRNKKGKPDNKKRIIGKIDKTGVLILNRRYLTNLKDLNIDVFEQIKHIESRLNIPEDKAFSKDNPNHMSRLIFLKGHPFPEKNSFVKSEKKARKEKTNKEKASKEEVNKEEVSKEEVSKELDEKNIIPKITSNEQVEPE